VQRRRFGQMSLMREAFQVFTSIVLWQVQIGNDEIMRLEG
jgi:hypothetical protein